MDAIGEGQGGGTIYLQSQESLADDGRMVCWEAERRARSRRFARLHARAFMSRGEVLLSERTHHSRVRSWLAKNTIARLILLAGGMFALLIALQVGVHALAHAGPGR